MKAFKAWYRFWSPTLVWNNGICNVTCDIRKFLCSQNIQQYGRGLDPGRKLLLLMITFWLKEINLLFIVPRVLPSACHFDPSVTPIGHSPTCTFGQRPTGNAYCEDPKQHYEVKYLLRTNLSCEICFLLIFRKNWPPHFFFNMVVFL